MHKQSCNKCLFGFLCLILVFIANGPFLQAAVIYQSAFASGTSGFTVTQQQPSGSIALSTVIEEARHCLLVSANQLADGKVVLTLTLPTLTFRDEAHFWQVDLLAKGDFIQGTAALNMDAVDSGQNRIDIIQLNEIQNTSNLQPLSFVVGVPKCWPNQKSTLATQANFILTLDQFQGDIYLADINIKTYQMPPDVEQQWQEPGPMEYGALPWVFPGQYENPSNQAKIIRDNVHKFNYLAGIRKMEIIVYWGGGSNPDPSHGTEGWEPGDAPVFERNKGVYEFEQLDNMLDDLEAYGFQGGVCSVLGLPDWTFTLADYRAFVTELVTHFKDRIDTWRPFGEVDNTMWMEEYEVYLQNFYTAAKAADPGCTVLCARVGVWLPFMLRNGMGDYMDGVTCHPFPGRAGNAYWTIYRMRQYQYGLISAGLKMPVYNTQMGYGAGWGWPGPGGQRNEQIKADQIRDTWPQLDEITPASYYYACVMGDRWYGWLRSKPDSYVYEPFGNHERLVPQPALDAMTEVSGSLGENSPIFAQVTFSPDQLLAKGSQMEVTLTATNISAQPVEIKFWPFGFVENLSGTFEDLQAHDWTGTLNPGQTHTAIIPVIPKKNRHTLGLYPVGLIVITPEGTENAYAVKDIIVDDIAYRSVVTASYAATGSSYCLNPQFDLSAVNDLREPVWSFDESLPVLSWEGHTGTSEWVQYDFDREYTVAGAEVFWLDDSEPRYGFGLDYNKFRGPQSWNLQYWDGNTWQDVENPSGYWATLDQFDQVLFEPVSTTKLRINAQLRGGYSGGIHEWRVLSLEDLCSSYWIDSPPGDLNQDCRVDLTDMGIVAMNWLMQNLP